MRILIATSLRGSVAVRRASASALSSGLCKASIWTLVALLSLTAGCRKPSTPLYVKVIDPPPSRNLRCQVARGYYQPTERDTMTISLLGTGNKGGVPSRETLVLEMLWRSKPGATWSDPTGTNVKITYIVDLAGSSLIFDGAGFLRVWENKQKTELLGEIQSSSLHLRSHPGVLDPSMKLISIGGTFHASRNPAQTVENVLKAKQYLQMQNSSGQ